MSNWISVEDDLPKGRIEVLFYIAELDQIEIGKYNELLNKWMLPYSDHYLFNGHNWVTHWQTLPEPPKGK